jgi:hypothetical protein
VIAAACSALAGCGSSDGRSTDSTPDATTYGFTAPTLGAKHTFTTVDVDDSANTINRTYEETVASVGADGSYTLSEDDPTNSSLTVDGILYDFPPRALSYDANGHETSAVIQASNGTNTCHYTLQSGGHALPWSVGQTWTQTTLANCSLSGAETSNIAGQVVSLESVTVPAGTFMALKLQSTETYTTPAGQNVVETITHWADPAHSLFTVKTVTTYARSGNVPTHYVASETIELQSLAD